MTADARKRPPGAGAPRAPEPAVSAPVASGVRAGGWLGPLGIGLALVAVTRITMWFVLPNATEDAYITFRYARNLAAGHGLVYNLGERVMGFTSPLWTLWCALGIALFRDPLLWTRLSTLAADTVTLVVLVSMLTRHASRAAAWCFAVAFGTWPFFGALAASGMESSSMIALCALSAWAVERRSPLAGPLLGALVLMRPEGLLCAVPIGWRAGGRDRLLALAIAAIGAAVMGWYFGSPIPNSVLAKAAVYGLPGPLAARHWWDWIVPPEIVEWPRQMEGIELYQIRVVLAPAALLGLVALWRTPMAGLAVAGLAVWGGFLLTGAPFFYWYMAFPIMVTFLLASAGLPRVLRGRGVFVALAMFFAGTWTLQPRLVYRTRGEAEQHLFASTAAQLARSARPGDSVFLEPLGFVGWANPDLRIHDEVGLVTPEVARSRRGPGWYADYVDREHPTWLVVRYGMLTTGASFAGNGAPFRSEDERKRTFDQYHGVAQSSTEMDDNEMVVMRSNRSAASRSGVETR